MKTITNKVFTLMALLLVTGTTWAQKYQLTAIVEVQQLSCFGGNDAYISLSPSGGSAPYVCSWSTGQTGPTISNLSAGQYTAHVTDAGNTTISIVVMIDEPVQISATPQITHVSTFGGSDGAIDLSVSGGTGTYDYLWSSTDTTEDVTGLTAGIYTVTITDENGCSTMQNLQVFQPEQSFNGPSVTLIHDHIYNGSVGSADPAMIGTAYPNPSKGDVSFKSDEEQVDQIRIYTITGNLIAELNASELMPMSFEKGEYIVHYLQNNNVLKSDMLVIK